MRSFLGLFLLGSTLGVLVGCDEGSTSTGTGGSAGSGGSGGGSGAVCTDPVMVACSDQVIQQMNFQKDITPGLITNTADGAGFQTDIDATAGGAFTSDPDSYTYGKFTDQGLVKVEISDEQSLDSMDWDIAFRRYVARINSGNSGPSCVAAARVPGGAKFEDVTEAPDTVPYRTDDYFSDACELIPDGSGLPGSPATALSQYWSYVNCVKMTGNVYVIRLADGRNVKFVVDSFYEPTVQEQCNTMDMIPMSNTGSANFKVRWAFLP